MTERRHRVLVSTVIASVVVSCSSPSRTQTVSSPEGALANEPAAYNREPFLTRIYAPPSPPDVRCPGGVPVALAPEWISMKNDDRTSPADVTVQLDAAGTCAIGVGPLPRLCNPTPRWSMTCTNRDGSRPHVATVRCTGGKVEVVVIAPEGEVRIAELARGAGEPPCDGR